MKTRTMLLLGALMICVMSLGFQFNNGYLGVRNGRLEAQSPPVPTRLLYAGVASTTLTTASTMLTAPANGLRYYFTDMACVNTSSTASAVELRDGTTTVIWRGACPPSGAAGGQVKFDPPFRQPTTATAPTMAVSAAGSTNYFSLRAYQDR